MAFFVFDKFRWIREAQRPDNFRATSFFLFGSFSFWRHKKEKEQ
jgi:hypothetical protein